MGKKGGVNKNNPDALKEAGNKAFSLKQFDEAIELYTKAINLDQNNHVYYANRMLAIFYSTHIFVGANAYLESSNFE